MNILTKPVPLLVREYTSFKRQNNSLVCERADGKTEQVKIGDWMMPDGLDPLLHDKLSILRTGFKKIEDEMVGRGIIDNDSMGMARYDFQNRYDCRYVPTPLDSTILAMHLSQRLPERENRNLVDLGGGLGYPCFTGKFFGLNPTVIEVDPDLLDASKSLSRLFVDLPQLSQTTFINQSFYDVHLGKFGYVFIYLWDNIWDNIFENNLFVEKLSDELKPGTVVIIYGNLNASSHPPRFHQTTDDVFKLHLYEVMD